MVRIRYAPPYVFVVLYIQYMSWPKRFFDFRPIPLLLIVKKIPCVLDGSCSLTKTEKKILVFTVLGWAWVFISYDSIYSVYRVTWQAFLEGLEVWKSILTFLLGR